MPAYVIAQIEVTDPDRYERYKPLAAAAVEKYQGRYVVRGGAKEDLEGEWPVPRLVILEFPSMQAARDWYRSPEYARAKEARAGGGRMTLTAVEGL